MDKVWRTSDFIELSQKYFIVNIFKIYHWVRPYVDLGLPDPKELFLYYFDTKYQNNNPITFIINKIKINIILNITYFKYYIIFTYNII